jgi:hypothetical protein
MAFPAIATSASTSDNDSSSPWTENLPASIALGDLLVMAAWQAASTTALTWPAGWVQISATNAASGTGRFEVRYRLADGTEGATISISGGGGTTRLSSVCFRITGWHGTTVPEGGTPATGTSTTPDPPTVTASWGSADNLFLAIFGQFSHTTLTPTAPTSYGGRVVGANSGGTDPNSGKVCFSSQQLASSNDNPATWTGADNEAWVAQTIVIRPVLSATGRSFGYIF